jgi:hypothetical protein
MAPNEAPLTFTSGASGATFNAATGALGGLNTTTLGQTPPEALYSTDATVAASAWQLPQNAGSLRLPSGVGTTTPVNPKTRADLSQAVDMIQILDRLQSNQPLTPAELRAAATMGPVVSRAAEMLGRRKDVPAKPPKKGPLETSVVNGTATVAPSETKGSPAKTVLPKGTKQAVNEATTEIAHRLEAKTGITAEELTKNGMGAPVPERFASMMQNAGYAVTKTMNVGQALQAANSQGPLATPSPDISAGLTVGQYIQQLAHMPKAQIYQLQQSLFNGGFYDPAYSDGSKKYTQGVLDVGTIEAMRTAILQTLQQHAAGKNTSLEQVIGAGQAGNTIGSLGSTTGTNSTQPIPVATQAQTQQPLINAFVAALGRAPSQAELQAFTSSYTSQLQAGNKNAVESGLSPSGMVDYQTGIPFINGVPTVSAAASQYAENKDPNEYQGHNIADAFGMLMNLVDRQGVSALDTPGTRPTTTT